MAKKGVFLRFKGHGGQNFPVASFQIPISPQPGVCGKKCPCERITGMCQWGAYRASHPQIFSKLQESWSKISHAVSRGGARIFARGLILPMRGLK